MNMDMLIDLATITFLAVLTLEVGTVAVMHSRRMVLARRSHEVSVARLRAEIDLIADRRRIEREKTDLSWNGFRKFEISEKTEEAAGVCSFYLTPHDRKPLPPFEPGQFLTFGLKIRTEAKVVTRCYSLSDSPGKTDYCRVTIKRVPSPPDRPDLLPGKASNFFHDELEVGDIVDVQAPSGHYYLDTLSHNPVVLIGGGIGVTPVLSMLNSIIEAGSQRETHFFYGIVNGADHAFKEHLQQIAQENENVHLHVCYSRPRKEDIEGQDYQHAGWVSVDLFKQILNSNNYDFYICGPPAMMDSLVTGLAEWGVPEQHVHFESFGPASVKRAKDDIAASTGERFNIFFARSDKQVIWDPEVGDILDFAEAQGIVTIDAGCRTGNCGSCIVAIKEGEIEYINAPGSSADDGSCHACISVPKSDLVIDA